MGNYTSADIIAFLEYHNKPNRWGIYRKITGEDFSVQSLQLNEVDFAILISDFFITFGVCSQHYDASKYFPEKRVNGLVALLLSRGKKNMLTAITVQDLTHAANAKQWPAPGVMA